MEKSTFLEKTGTLHFKAMLILCAVYLPLVLLLLFIMFYSGSVLKRKSYESQLQLMDYYMYNLDDRLENLEDYLRAYVTGNEAVQAIAFSRVYPEQYELYKYQAYQRLVEAVAGYEAIDYMYIYDSSVSRCYLAGKVEQEYAIREDLSEAVETLLEKNRSTPSEWFCFEGPQVYLMRNIKYGNAHIGILLKAENCMNMGSFFSEDSNVVLCDETGEYMESLFPLPEDSQSPAELSEGEWVEVGGQRWLQLYVASRMGSFYLAGLIPERAVYANVMELYGVSSILIAAGMLLIPVCVILVRKEILKPTRHLADTISRIAEGDTKVRAGWQENMAVEFQMIYEAFDHMMNQLEKLQEELLEKQKTEQRLELLQLQYQIRPHFFLNSLNGIYSLAETGQDRVIQELVLNLSRYFRYVFRADRSFVRIREECGYVSSYADIRKILQRDMLYVTVQFDKEIEEGLIPPFTVITFVENSFKHGAIANKRLKIEVSARRAGKEYLEIIISDNGKGFSAEALRKLESRTMETDERGEHTGIFNVCERLRYTYRKPVFVDFANKEEGGSEVRLKIPFIRTGGQENVSDIIG